MPSSSQLLSQLGLPASSSVTQAPTIPTGMVDPTDASSTFDPNSVTVVGNPTSGASTNDMRIRLRAMRGQEDVIYGASSTNNLLSMLHPVSAPTGGTDGLLFPYTPSISVNQEVDYRDIGSMTHTIGDILSYNHTPSVKLDVTATFTVQNQREGMYALAALHFLRTVSKMYFGEIDAKNGLAGLPPPILIFTGYGDFMFNNLPVIVKSHSYSLDKSMNMITITTPEGGTASLPSMFDITISLQVQQTPTAMRTVFSLDSFRTGELMLNHSGDTGWI
jgi:hypothetical protein